MRAFEIISGGNSVKACDYRVGTRVLIDGTLYVVVNWSETTSRNNQEFLKVERSGDEK